MSLVFSKIFFFFILTNLSSHNFCNSRNIAKILYLQDILDHLHKPHSVHNLLASMLIFVSLITRLPLETYGEYTVLPFLYFKPSVRYYLGV